MSQTPKVVVTDFIEPDMAWEAEEMDRRGVDFVAHQLKFRPEEEVIEAVKDADVIVVNMVGMTANIINSLTKCRLIIRYGAGYDNVDAAACTAKGIPLAYCPDYCMGHSPQNSRGHRPGPGRPAAAARSPTWTATRTSTGPAACW